MFFGRGRGRGRGNQNSSNLSSISFLQNEADEIYRRDSANTPGRNKPFLSESKAAPWQRKGDHSESQQNLSGASFGTQKSHLNQNINSGQQGMSAPWRQHSEVDRTQNLNHASWKNAQPTSGFPKFSSASNQQSSKLQGFAPSMDVASDEMHIGNAAPTSTHMFSSTGSQQQLPPWKRSVQSQSTSVGNSAAPTFGRGIGFAKTPSPQSFQGIGRGTAASSSTPFNSRQDSPHQSTASNTQDCLLRLDGALGSVSSVMLNIDIDLAFHDQTPIPIQPSVAPTSVTYGSSDVKEASLAAQLLPSDTLIEEGCGPFAGMSDEPPPSEFMGKLQQRNSAHPTTTTKFRLGFIPTRPLLHVS